MHIDRVQGLIDLYHKAGKSRAAVRTMADYLRRQGLMTQADVDALSAALDAQDKSRARLDLRAALTEVDQLRGELLSTQEALASLYEAMVTGGGAVMQKITPPDQA